MIIHEAHPRFNTTGASTGRLSSSRFNAMNIPKRGLMAAARKVVTAFPGYKLAKADYGQGELRVCLFYAGVDPARADGSEGFEDIFYEMVDNAQGQYKRAATLMSGKERDVAKSVSHACVTGAHDVLTRTGWKRIDALYDRPEEIAVWEGDGSLRWERPSWFHKSHFTGDLTSLRGRGFSIDMTPNHELPFVVSGTWEDRKYAKLRKSTWENHPKSGAIPVTGVLDDKPDQHEMFSDAEIQRAVAVQADGSLNGNKKVRFHLKRPRKLKRIMMLFPDLVLKPSYDGRFQGTITFSSPLIDENKEFTNCLMHLSQRQRLLFLEEVLLWDGSKGKGNSKTYTNTKRISCEWVQLMAHLSGSQSLFRWHDEDGKKRIHNISQNRRTYTSANRLDVHSTPHDGPVYCVTVSSGYFLFRHNDRIGVSGNSNYCEGLSLRSGADTMNKTALAERNAGALIVYDGSEGRPVWKYRNKIVCFTGGNLAERLFGDRTRDNRRLANELRLQYFKMVPELIEWQMKLTHDTQWTRIVRSASGKMIRLLGTAEDDMKLCFAFMGQNGLAEYCQECMLRFGARGDIASIQCHDELLFCEIPLDYTNDDAKAFFRPMVEPSEILKGFTCPIEIKMGKNWMECDLVGKLRYTGWPLDTHVSQLLV